MAHCENCGRYDRRTIMRCRACLDKLWKYIFGETP